MSSPIKATVPTRSPHGSACLTTDAGLGLPLAEALPLTHLERFFWSCDRPEHPMVLRIGISVHGTVDRPLLEQAFQLAVSRHPLLTSRIVGEEQQNWAPSDIVPQLEWTRQPMRVDGSSVAPIDLTRSAGLRAWASEEDGRIDFIIDFHHCCCDGLATRQLFADWFGSYDQMLRGEPLRLLGLEPERLHHRGEFNDSSGKQQVGFWEGLRNLYVTVTGKTARLPQRAEGSAAADHLVERPMTADQTERVRRRIREREITINDLGLAACLSAFARLVPESQSRHQVTVMNPINLRRPSDRRLPAANRIGFAFMRRRVSECRSLDGLLDGLHEEMTYVKERNVGAEFVKGLAVMDSMPWLYRWIHGRDVFTPSLIFTCIGDRSTGIVRKQEDRMVVGGLALDYISGFAPTGPRVPFSVGFCESPTRLAIAVRGAAAFVDAADCRQFAEQLVSDLLIWADEHAVS